MIRKIAIFFGIAAVLVAAAILYSHPPGESNWYPPCPVKKWIGLDCPGCGSTRATYQLMHGHVARAADHNILLILFLPMIFIGLTATLTGNMRTSWAYLNRPKLVLLAVLTFWILRNIPIFPFLWLHSDK